ncbi:CRM-domain containing factor CFM3, chloroplastic/mitochondrial [Phoenix dactylifera]|uniref:CRM-domain containing factor CFM3, chloroplastic/mitochondrial n=1 Tax=Phoenix dactylifera TaxID=42345 RepID=A0A8B7CNE9_PHODC|nr:CRM-domain containing factor CFM3, chloroplastic/mitochondrial [Phoenix dactylifera]
MALAPTLQLHPAPIFDSLHASLSRLQSPRLLLFRSSSSTAPSKKLRFSANSIHDQAPDGKSSPYPGPGHRPRRLPAGDLSSRPTWIQSWNQSRLLTSPKRPRAFLDYREGISSDDDVVGTSRSTGSSTMEKIVEKLKKFGYIDVSDERKESPLPEKGSVEDIFYAEDGILPDSRGGLSLDLNKEVRFPWEKPLQNKEGDGGGSSMRKRRSKTSLAELTLPEGELRRLRHMAVRIKSKTKIKGAGVTKDIVDLIHEQWKTTEVVRLKCEGAPALNMKRTHEILERKTGGLVIWRSGTSISLYRGVGYEIPQPEKKQYQSVQRSAVDTFNKDTYYPTGVSIENGRGNNIQDLHEDLTASLEKKKDTEPDAEIKYEHEIDKLLDGLGPRYTDWPGSGPLPVDADLLPGVIPGYKPPFRILPYGVRRTLGLKEGTALRRLARLLPPHFALGRSRQHQGLAAAMVKLWEKSSIAKIALKRGVQLTTSERMAEEIKKLTGGTILSSNKDYLVFYRGKDFLAPEVTEALLERETLAKTLQDEEEQARLRASSSVVSNFEIADEPGTAGTLGETLEADARWGNRLDEDHMEKMMRAAEMARHADLVRKLERRLSLAERRLMKAEKALAKVEESLKPAEHTVDPESITEEERFMFRKLGLRMKAFLLLGRRGVFAGTVENMHLHWKYRELVKVIVKTKTFEQAKYIALSLESESGGVLVSVDKVSKGFAIIVYRGKDYERPSTLRPKNLLTKRKALARSIELQRHEALSRHISNLQKRVEQLRSELVQMDNVKDQGDEELYTKLDSAYSTEDEDTEDDDDEAYLHTFNTAVVIDGDEYGRVENYANNGGAADGGDDGYEDGDGDEDDESDVFEDNEEDSIGFVRTSMNSIQHQQTGMTDTAAEC